MGKGHRMLGAFGIELALEELLDLLKRKRPPLLTGYWPKADIDPCTSKIELRAWARAAGMARSDSELAPYLNHVIPG